MESATYPPPILDHPRISELEQRYDSIYAVCQPLKYAFRAVCIPVNRLSRIMKSIIGSFSQRKCRLKRFKPISRSAQPHRPDRLKAEEGASFTCKSLHRFPKMSPSARLMHAKFLDTIDVENNKSQICRRIGISSIRRSGNHSRREL